MELFLNGRRLELDGQYEQGTLKEVIDFVAREHVPLSHVITEVWVDGRRMSPEEERQAGEEPVAGVNKLELTTADPAALTREGLAEALNYMERLIPGLARIASLLRIGDLAEAGRLLAMAAEGIQWFASLIEMGQRFIPVDYKRDYLAGSTVWAHYQKLENIVSALAELQQNQEWTALAQLMEEKLIPHFESWKEMLPLMVSSFSRSKN